MRSSASINLLNEYLVLKGESLGKGATGEVFLGRNLRDSTEVAVKVIELKSIDN
jgi:serine/threonine protein kinase